MHVAASDKRRLQSQLPAWCRAVSNSHRRDSCRVKWAAAAQCCTASYALQVVCRKMHAAAAAAEKHLRQALLQVSSAGLCRLGSRPLCLQLLQAVLQLLWAVHRAGKVSQPPAALWRGAGTPRPRNPGVPPGKAGQLAQPARSAWCPNAEMRSARPGAHTCCWRVRPDSTSSSRAPSSASRCCRAALSPAAASAAARCSES